MVFDVDDDLNLLFFTASQFISYPLEQSLFGLRFNLIGFSNDLGLSSSSLWRLLLCFWRSPSLSFFNGFRPIFFFLLITILLYIELFNSLKLLTLFF